jgi:hypothetical protein
MASSHSLHAGKSQRSVAEVEGFVRLLMAACNDKKISAALERLLTMPDKKRRNLVHVWVSDLLIEGAPSEFVQAVGCLMDDAVAEKAYEVIFKCQRGETL